MNRALRTSALLLTLAMTPGEAPGVWRSGETRGTTQEEGQSLATEARALVAELQLNATPELSARFLELFRRIYEADHVTASPETAFAIGDAYFTASRLARAGDDAFLEALMLASLGPYGRSAGGGEFLDQLLWECLEDDAGRTFEVLGRLPAETRRVVMKNVYAAPVHDGFDFERILRSLQELDPPERLRADVHRVQAACWESLHGPFDFARDVGLVGADVHGDVCLAIGRAEIPPGYPVTLVSPWGQELHSAQVAGRRETPCWVGVGETRMALGEDEDTTYRLTGLGERPADDDAYIAVLFPLARFTVQGDQLRADLDREGADEGFRICTSMEGLHLTVWSGEPLTGRRRWHRYVYLGFEIASWEGSCVEADYAGL